MDFPRQLSTPRNKFDANSFQTQGMLTRSKARESAPFKRRKLETNPLKIGHILEKVFSFLDGYSIKLARQVDKEWSAEGAKMLFNKCFVKIPTDLRFGESSTKKDTMEKFKSFLSCKSREVSMIPNIMIEGAGDVQLWKSLGVLGPQVTSLHFDSFTEELFNNLLNLLPNLKYLSFKDPFCETNITDVLSSVMTKAGRDQNPLIILFIGFQLDSARSLECIEKLSNCKSIMIEELYLTFSESIQQPHKDRFTFVLKKLLSTSRNTLKKMYVYNATLLDGLSLVEFPCMTALTHLDLTFDLETPGNLGLFKFAPSFRFAENVPNLYSITVCMVYSRTDDEDNVPAAEDAVATLFQGAGCAPSVQRLKYSVGALDLNIDPLFQIFPNIKHFEVSETAGFQKLFHSLWKHGQCLKSLQVTIKFGWSLGTVSDWDSIFTGFSPTTVEKIQKSSKLPQYSSRKLDAWRVDPSILNLKELEHLKIILEVGNHYPLPDRVLAVAGEYAFKYLPKNPRISIHIEDLRQSLKCDLADLDEVSQLSNVIVTREFF